MNKFASFTLFLSASLADAALCIKTNHSRCSLVLSEERVIGTLSEGDLLRAFLHGSTPSSSISDWVNLEFFWLKSYDLFKAHEAFLSLGITMIPVVTADMNLLDIITTFDVLRLLKTNESF